MTGDPNADEHSDKDDDDDEDEMDNNDSLGAQVAESDTDDSSQAGYSSECGTSSSVNHETASRSFASGNPFSNTAVNMSHGQPVSQANDGTSHTSHTNSLVAASWSAEDNCNQLDCVSLS